MKIDNIEIQGDKFIVNLSGENIRSYEDVTTIIIPQSELFDQIKNSFQNSVGVAKDCTTCTAFGMAVEPGFYCSRCPEKQEYCKLYEAKE